MERLKRNLEKVKCDIRRVRGAKRALAIFKPKYYEKKGE
jgi:hypothetical protein